MPTSSPLPEDPAPPSSGSLRQPGGPVRLVVAPDPSLEFPDSEEQAVAWFLDRNHAAWNALQTDYGPLRMRRLLSPATRDALREIVEDLRTESPGYRWPRFADDFLVNAPDASNAGAIIKRLNAWADVHLAYVYAESELASVVLPTASNGCDPYFAQQSYLRPGPAGIGAECVWLLSNGSGYAGADGDGVALVDIETGFNPDHEDLAAHFQPLGQNPRTPIGGVNATPESRHGTQVLGILCARNNDKGCCGIVPNLTHIAFASIRNPSPPPIDLIRSDDLCAAVSYLRRRLRVRGGVILIELTLKQAVGIPNSSPVELQQDDFDAIRFACDAGRIVIEPAGNGGHDLDQIVHPPLPDINHCVSGAILVAASGLKTMPSPVPHGPPARSHVPLRDSGGRRTNIGSRVDCFANGGGVTTCDQPPTSALNNHYCNDFGKTSAASAIIAGAALSLQGMATARLGRPLKAAEMRWLLKNSNLATMSERGLLDKIGVMPDLAKIAKLLKSYSPKTLRLFLP